MKGFPWWGSVILAIAVYNGLKYGIPKFMPLNNSTAEFLGLLAPLAAMAFLLLAGKQLYDGVPTEESEDDDNQNPSEE